MTFPFDLFIGLSQPQSSSQPDNRDLLYNGSIQSARYIDPITHDYVESSNNHLVGQNAIEQQVNLILQTTFNSAFISTFGQNFTSIKLIQPNLIVSQMSNLLNNALSVLINNGSISLNNLQINSTEQGQIMLNFTYTNNTINTTTDVTYLPNSGL